ncbi:MAG: SUMF1/EgtB/PvdO family nonheme iron enzyme [Anaerolineae bacterium]|nr:SUMF1/EgtB/PvdO family nonheme iron enzyme [Anaerolineae bacterium]
MTQVFLSHSTVDAEFALQLATDLRSAGVPVWKAPESILEGENWVAAIERGLSTSTHMLLLISPAAVDSKWVNFEFNCALSLEKQGKMQIIPIDYQPCEPPLFWRQIQWVDGIDDDYHAVLLRILARLREEQPSHPPEPTSASTTIHVHIGGDAGNITVAGRDIVYRDQPVEPPRMVTEPKLSILAPDPILDILPPPFEWCAIPAGQVSLEGYVEIFDVQPFYMAKYPITFEQFQVFIDDPEGFKNPEWWEGLTSADRRWKTPGKQKFTHEKHLPRDSVSWYDAVAFCRWLTAGVARLPSPSIPLPEGEGPGVRAQIRLPTEWEWQWAAQGPDGMLYPWGNDFDQNRCNTYESALQKTTPVDFYPAGASPFGVMDMSGNVWEWCLNEYHDLQQLAPTFDAPRVVRGGSWNSKANSARAASRDSRPPHSRGTRNGFRIVWG